MAGRHIPPGHGHPTSGSGDSNELCQGALRPREVADAKVADDDVERSIGDLKVFSVSLTKIHTRVSSRSKFHHSRCEVHANNRGSSAAGSPECDDAGTCGHIQNAQARPAGGRIQQGIYRVGGYRGKEVAITVCDFVVRVALEVPESVGIDVVVAHPHLARCSRADRWPSSPNGCGIRVCAGPLQRWVRRAARDDGLPVTVAIAAPPYSLDSFHNEHPLAGVAQATLEGRLVLG